MSLSPNSELKQRIDANAALVESKVIAWRRDIHQHPELSNREKRTSALVAKHLTSLGLEVQTGIAHHGVVGLLKGRKPGPIVALRADMDALPITEEVDLSFASKAKDIYDGKEVGVMHACGHDAHTAILMGVAEVLSKLKEDFSGSIKFIFQPAEEGAPQGEQGGANLMIEEGVLSNPKPEVIFGLHVAPMEVNTVGYRPNAFLASGSTFELKVKGRQTHGAMPWTGIDPIVIAAEIILAFQAIVSRQLDVISNPSIFSIGTIHAGNRANVIPKDLVMTGTIRAFSKTAYEELCNRIKQTAEQIAKSWNGEIEISFFEQYPVTINDPLLTEKMLPTLKRVAGEDRVSLLPYLTGSEDFAFYAQKIPGLFFMLGTAPEGIPLNQVAYNHSPRFQVNEKGLLLGVRLLAHLAIDYTQTACAL